MFGSHGRDCGGRWAGAGRGGWGSDPSFGWLFWGGPKGRRGHPGHFGGGRVFEQGDLKYVILQLLDEKPRHGYEIIKELEDRFRGAYSPSPGTVYPTLTMLEDLGYARITVEDGGKKTYGITDEGKAYLAQNKRSVDDIFERMANAGRGMFSPGMAEIAVAFRNLASGTFATASQLTGNTAQLQQVKDVLDRATAEILAIGK